MEWRHRRGGRVQLCRPGHRQRHGPVDPVPASACALVGVRPTRGLVSRSGIMPFSPTQDEVGPIARTAADAALVLDVMAGVDPADPVTSRGAGRLPPDWRAGLGPDALAGARRPC
ncbi:MAG: amidase family protein [Vicinamibacterales bacterium]